MGSLHWVIVIPYYFVATLAILPFLILACRLARLKLSINSLVGAAIVLSVAGIIALLGLHWVDLGRLTGRPLLALILASFVLAALDLVLSRALPLPLDNELREL